MNFKDIINTWIAPKDDKPKGMIAITTPDGKTTINAELETSSDAQKIKDIVNILFPDVTITPEEFFTIGRTE